MALAFLIPAAPAVAQAATPGLNAACQTVERKVYKDIRELVKIDLDTATDLEVRILAGQILSAANTDAFSVLPAALQTRLGGTADELRAFLKSDMQKAWATDLRITVVQTLTDAGHNVSVAAQKALDAGAIDAYLTYLNDELYTARALDCPAKPTATPTVAPTASSSPSSSAAPGASGGEGGGEGGGGLPLTGAATGMVAGIGGALLLLGGAAFLIGRRRRSQFVA